MRSEYVFAAAREIANRFLLVQSDLGLSPPSALGFDTTFRDHQRVAQTDCCGGAG